MTSGNLIQGKLRPDLFNELLNGSLSTRIAYSRANLCPCSAERSPGDSNPRCPVCSGLGYSWQAVVPTLTAEHWLTRNPVAGYEDQERLPNPSDELLSITDEYGLTYPLESVVVRPDGTVKWLGPAPATDTRYQVVTSGAALRAGVQSVMSRREYQVRGEYDVLDLSMTIDRYLADQTTLNPAWDCGESDRFVLLDAWRRHAQKVIRGENGPQAGGDLLLYRHMQDLRVSSIDGSSVKIWENGTDYAFNDGKIIWQAGRGPKLGQSYAVQGQANPEYFVFKALPQLRHEDGLDLPRRIILKGFESWPNRRPAAPVSAR